MAAESTSGPPGTGFLSAPARFGMASRRSCRAANVSMDPGGVLALKPRDVRYQIVPAITRTTKVKKTKSLLMAVTNSEARSTGDSCGDRFERYHGYNGFDEKGVETRCECGSTDPCTWRFTIHSIWPSG